VGFLPPAVHIRDNLELRPSCYRVLLKGVVVGEGEAFSGMYLAINPGHIKVPIEGSQTTDPAFGLQATWIEARVREQAQMVGYTVVDAATVIATHLNHLMQSNAAVLLGRSEVEQLLEHVGKFSPKLVADVVPKVITLPVLQKVLRSLLEEAVHVRDLRGILELLAEHGANTQDPAELARELRVGLSPAIVQDLYGAVKELGVMAIEPGLEQLLVQAMTPGAQAPLDPGIGELLSRQAGDAARQQEEAGLPACLLVPDRIRAQLARLLKRGAPRLRVLAHSEIPETHSIRINRVIGAQ
jgi:flagellar biosynthesis protein FlhA